MAATITDDAQPEQQPISLPALPAERFGDADLCSHLSMMNGRLKSMAARQVLDPLLRTSNCPIEQRIKSELEKNVSNRPNFVEDLDFMGASISQTCARLAGELWDALKVGISRFSRMEFIKKWLKRL